MGGFPAGEPGVEKSIEIEAPAHAVWRVLTEPEQIAKWMGGARVESKWEAGAEITFVGKLHNVPYVDRGTVLAVEPERLLQYSHWTRLSRLPDLPQNRTLITFSLVAAGVTTNLTVRHECFYSEAAYKHANYFWGFALEDVRNLLEPTRTTC